MKKVLILSALLLSLSACASGPAAYGPAASYGDTGFRNTKLQYDRFRVSYTGHSPEEAYDMALLRSAQIATAEGYSHFKVVNGHVDGNGRASPLSTSVGIGVGSGYRGHTRTNVGVGVGLNDVGRMLEGDKATQGFEIILQNTGTKDPNVYDAKSIEQSIKPAVFK